MEKKEGHFVLVHGACHGAWCWYKVITQLKSMGHKVTAMDLAGAGIHPKEVQEAQSFPDYFEPLMNFMASAQPEEKVILVGHSLGGYSISAAMERFPEKVAVAVFATAFMPGPNLPYLTISQQLNERLSPDKTMDIQFLFQNGLDKPPTSALFGHNFLASKLYQLSPPEDLTLALTLIRHVGVFNDEESIKAVAVTKEKYGTVPRVYVVCGKDNVIKEDFQRWMIENNPSDEVKSISDSDHMVMFSKPNQLCTCLEEIAEKYT
ncbi:LOW QUALITY PROTEIN: methyl jasmonate esterase 1-like [Gossypium arboreum]|uniref:LOW QUALITY PROTEIN: methyl jasmonate esterase 1-like n=1 Tax=Gossypium arboreum TaxID=29729 RepID=UPI0022F188A1|nr:LOW QUALITY PROTEIN: methyl jasmonate esterase 1-like [Gossypium arboreum]